jgi:hypothetical protein
MSRQRGSVWLVFRSRKPLAARILPAVNRGAREPNFFIEARECVASAWHSHNHKKTTLTSHLAIGCLMKGRLMALAIFGVAVAMLACMQGWNAAAHRKDESTARVMSILFYVFTAVLIGSLAKMMFFGG